PTARAPGRLPGAEAARRGSVRAPAEDPAELARARGRGLAGGRRGGARIARPSDQRARRGARAGRVRRAQEGTRVRRAPAPAKLNLALVVGSGRPDGKHEVTTVLQRIDLADRVAVQASEGLRVDGFADDTL